MTNPNQLITLGYLILIVVLFYFLLIRPQQKRQREHNELVESLGVGDKVVTIGGVHGTIKRIDEDTLVLEVADNVRITLSKTAVAKSLD